MELPTRSAAAWAALSPGTSTAGGIVAEVVVSPPARAHRAHLYGMELHLRGEYRAAIRSSSRPLIQAGFTVPLLWAIREQPGEHEQAAAITETVSACSARRLPSDSGPTTCRVAAGDRRRCCGRWVGELVPDSEVLAQLGCDAMHATIRVMLSSTGAPIERGGSHRGHRTGSG
jgi:hypothetical protein